MLYGLISVILCKKIFIFHVVVGGKYVKVSTIYTSQFLFTILFLPHINLGFPIAFCDEKNVEVRIGKSSSETTECSLETLTVDQKTATTDAQTNSKKKQRAKKLKGKPKKSRKSRKKGHPGRCT